MHLRSHRTILAALLSVVAVVALFCAYGSLEDEASVHHGAAAMMEPEEANFSAESSWDPVGFGLFERRDTDANALFQEMYNTVEDVKLQQYIASAKHSIKAVIVILAYTPRVKSLTNVLLRLHKSFNWKFRYPIVIFHEADFLPHAEYVRHGEFIENKGGTSPIFFQQIDLSVPDWILKRFGPLPVISCARRSIGYRSMCRFQAKLMYEEPVMRHFDYYWRLDDDSEINSPIPFDLFGALVSGGFSYGFALTSIDDCAHDMYSVTQDYMKARNITPTFFSKLRRNEIVLNNFEVSSMKFWLSKQYRDYIEYIDNLGGIYMHRWGDAPIKTLALSMHVPQRQIHRFKNISYGHNGNPRLWTKFMA